MILNQKFLPDIRVEQEIDALIEIGYRVIVIASELGINTDKYEIIRINPNKGLSRYYNLTLKWNPILLREIVHELEVRHIFKIDAVHVHDLLWSFIGVKLSKKYMSKLVIDFHEPYSEFIEVIRKHREKYSFKQYVWVFVQSLINPKNDYLYRLLFNYFTRPKRLKKYEKKVIRRCDRYIVVVDEAFNKFELSQKSKGIVVSNSKDPNKWYFEELPIIKDKLIVTYMGTIQDLRGVDTAIEAMKYIDQNKFVLNIVGVKKGILHDKFLNIIKNNNIKNVNLIEFIKEEQKAFEYIKNTHIGIVPHKNTKLTQEALPHKMFMYMAKGRPVLVSNMGPLKRMVEYSNNGYIFEAGDSLDFAKKLDQFYDNRYLLKKMAVNGRKAVEEKYNWNVDKKRFLDMYNDLV